MIFLHGLLRKLNFASSQQMVYFLTAHFLCFVFLVNFSFQFYFSLLMKITSGNADATSLPLNC